MTQEPINPALPVAVYIDGELYGSYLDLSAAQAATKFPFFDELPELNELGLPVGCIAVQITLKTFNAILNGTD